MQCQYNKKKTIIFSKKIKYENSMLLILIEEKQIIIKPTKSKWLEHKNIHLFPNEIFSKAKNENSNNGTLLSSYDKMSRINKLFTNNSSGKIDDILFKNTSI